MYIHYVYLHHPVTPHGVMTFVDFLSVNSNLLRVAYSTGILVLQDVSHGGGIYSSAGTTVKMKLISRKCTGVVKTSNSLAV